MRIGIGQSANVAVPGRQQVFRMESQNGDKYRHLLEKRLISRYSDTIVVSCLHCVSLLRPQNSLKGQGLFAPRCLDAILHPV